MAEFYRKVNEEKSYHRAIFLAVSLAVAGLCSVYPIACFKKVSSKERAKLRRGVEELDRKKDERDRTRRHSSYQGDLPPRTTTRHHRRRHSAATPKRYASPSSRYNRELRRTAAELEMDRSPRPYARQYNQGRPQRETEERRGGHRPRRHHNSMDGLFKTGIA